MSCTLLQKRTNGCEFELSYEPRIRAGDVSFIPLSVTEKMLTKVMS